MATGFFLVAFREALEMKTRGGRKIRPDNILAPYSWRVPHRLLAGFSILECLISLSLSLLILVSALEVSVRARRVFMKLSESQEKNLAMAIALEKIREDLETAGAGIPGPLPDSDFAPVQVINQTLTIFSAEVKTSLLADTSPGEAFLFIELISGLSALLKKGQAVYLAEGTSGRLLYINAVAGNRLTVSPSLDIAFEAGRTAVIILEKVEVYLDVPQKILRRRVNNTTGQPLAEDITGFSAGYQEASNLVFLSLTAESGGKNYEYELVVCPKNLGLF